VNAHKQEVADVYVEDGIIVAVKPNIKVSVCFFFFFPNCNIVNSLYDVFLN
jgi:dihydroorotase-like cyclic amidohydrolase